MSNELFTMRPAREDDLELINIYAYNEGMPDIPGVEGVTVAANADDQVVGFIRIKHGADGIAHVNPVVVYAAWRRYGVGRALVEDALAREGELRLVSRGGSLAFYRALKRMEEAELVTSHWETPEEGSAKRLFTLTDKGRSCLRRWIDTLACYQLTLEELRIDASDALGIELPDTPQCSH